MNKDEAIKRATVMRRGITRMLKIAQDSKMPFAERYRAVILAEDYEYCATHFDALAEKERGL